MAYATEWTPGLQNALLAPFDSVEFLPKGGKDGGNAQGMPYIDSRAVQIRLDSTVGPGNWSFSFSVIDISKTQCRVMGILTVLGVAKCEAGEAEDTRAGAEVLKQAVSDALKRCGVHFGIGRYLYELEGPFWGKLNQYKRWETAPTINGQTLAKALKAVGYTWEGNLPEVRTVAAPSYEDETPQRSAPTNGNGQGRQQQRPPESRGDAAATAANGDRCPECNAPAGKHGTKCSRRESATPAEVH